VLRFSTAGTEQLIIGVSAGTADVVGLRSLRQHNAPTTAYLMIGERCALDCAFCAQASSSSARSRFLSRVTWPLYPTKQVLPSVAEAFRQHRIARCCFQVTSAPGSRELTVSSVHHLRTLGPVPICVSTLAPHVDAVRALLSAGAERVTLALDAASERVFRATKSGLWHRQMDLLQESAAAFPGHVGTHLIVGLGETEQEMVQTMQWMVDRQITIGLFSFTPVAGTAMSECLPPPLPTYRRVQVARYLLTTGSCRAENLKFSTAGQITGFGLSRPVLREWLANGDAFRTAGCPDCNRPYYNERPGRTMYNYPRALTSDETDDAVRTALGE
jgi:lipoyl synthase